METQSPEAMAFERKPFNEDRFMEQEFHFIKALAEIENVVETGTYKGRTTEWFANNFKNVFTTEINETFYNEAIIRLSPYKNVIARLGDSTQLLPVIIEELKKLNTNTAFFLDAHWYTNPLLGELTAIFASGYIPKYIVIHDMANPLDPTMGFDFYPEQNISYNYEWVEPYLEKIYGGKKGEKFIIYYNKEAEGARRGCLFVYDASIHII